MKNTTKVLEVARKKLHFNAYLNELCAALTPAEIHALIDAGYKPMPGSRIPDRHDPASSPTWFYFQPVRGEFYQ